MSSRDLVNMLRCQCRMIVFSHCLKYSMTYGSGQMSTTVISGTLRTHVTYGSEVIASF